MKKSILLAGLLFATTNIYAQGAGKVIIGASFGTGSGKTEVTGHENANINFDSTTTIFTLGYTLSDTQRIILSHETIKQELEGYTLFNMKEPDNTGINLDFQYLLPAGQVKPYALIGLGSYKFDGSGSGSSDGSELSGLSFNYGIGLLFELSKNVELETSYRGKIINWQDIEYSGGQKSEMSTNVSHVTLGLNVLF